MIIGDFNCNLEDNHSPSNEVLMGVIPDTYNLLKNIRPYSFITVAQNVSNLDHVLYSHDCSNIMVSVGTEGLYSEHLQLSLFLPTSNIRSEKSKANVVLIAIGTMLKRNYVKLALI